MPQLLVDVIAPLAATISSKSHALTVISRSIVQLRVSSALPLPAGESASAVNTELACEAEDASPLIAVGLAR